MDTKYNYELIKDYLDGILDSKTSEELRRLLIKDETARSIANGILILEDRFKSDEETEDYLNQLLVKSQRQIIVQSSGNRRFFFLKVAASIALIIVSSFFIYQSKEPSAFELVENELSNPYKSAIVLRDAETVNNFEKAVSLYNASEYDQALGLLRNENTPQASFFRGLCLLYSDRFNLAIEELEKGDLSNSRFEEQGRWYLSLGYIKARKNTEANNLLDTIIKSESHYKQKEAEKLKVRLND